MESYELHLTDIHQFTSLRRVTAITQIDETTHLLQLVLLVGWYTNLCCTRYRDMIDRLDDAVAFIFGHETYNSILRPTLIEIF